MLKCILVCSCLLCGVSKIVSKGQWMIEKLERCPDQEEYTYDFALNKKKVNRTHDGFYGEFNLLEDVTEDDYAISIDVCKRVDGGCKSVVSFHDKSMCRFFFKHSEENFKKALKNMGMEEHCPIPKGNYEMVDYLFDNTELPKEGMVGTFISTATITKSSNMEKLACLLIHLHFKEDED